MHIFFYFIKQRFFVTMAETHQNGITAKIEVFPFQIISAFSIGQLHFLTARQFSTSKYLMIFP